MSDIKDLGKNLQKALNEAKKEAGSRQNMQRLGNSITKDMVKRIQLGYGVRSNEGRREKLAPLAESTKKQRAGKLAFWTDPGGKVIPVKTPPKSNKEYLQRNKPELSGNTRPNKSNLTKTGRLMRDIGSLATGFGKLTIGFKSAYGARVGAFVSKMRPFFFITDKEAKRAQKQVERTLTESLNRALRKYFK